MTLYPEIASLIVEVDAFIERNHITPTAFGIASVRDPNIYRLIKSGQNLTLKRIERIRAFMREHEGVPA